MYNPAFSTDSSPVGDPLIAGNMPIAYREVDIPAGTALTRGMVMGRITANGNFVQSLTAAADGSQAPVAILMQDVAASGGARRGLVALTGEFAFSKLILGALHTRATIDWPLRQLGIFIRDIVAP